jgi:hypothetical protein
MDKKLEEIRTKGLAVLKRELGVAGMIRFLQQFDKGSGNWAKERHKWVDQISMEDIRKMIAKPRARKQRRAG